MSENKNKDSKQDIEIMRLKTSFEGFKKMVETKFEFFGEKLDGFLKNDFIHLRDKVDNIEESLFKRPSWISSAVITIMCSVIVGLIVYIVTHY